jgi:ferredoxin
LTPMTTSGKGSIQLAADVVGLIFPVHIWGLPPLVVDFINRLQPNSPKYYFALAVNAGQVAATLLQLEKLFLAKGFDLDAGFSIDMPSNYIPWGGAIAEEKQQKKFKEALGKIKSIAGDIKAQKKLEPEKGPLWQNILFSFFYRKSFPHVHKMDKSFWTDEKCNSCLICEKICPVRNISITDGKPIWQHHCEQCFACLQWCPEEAIQCGKNTIGKKRYRHPEIKLQDMLACVVKK